MVISFGSSAEPMGGGSTYFRVVKSGQCQKICSRMRFQEIKHTLLLVDLHVHEKVYANDDQIRQYVKDPNA